MRTDRNVSLIIGLAVPVVMIVIVAASIYLPKLWAPPPRTSFLYTTGEGYYNASYQYHVSQGRLEKRDVKLPEHVQPVEVDLYLYDAASGASRELSFEEAQRLRLDGRDESPDGYTLRYGSSHGGVFPIFYSSGADHNAMYLTGHHVSRQVKLETAGGEGYRYYPRVRFVGWVLPGGLDGQS